MLTNGSLPQEGRSEQTTSGCSAKEDITGYETNNMGLQLINIYDLLDQKGYISTDPEICTWLFKFF